jgi:hypothetical protein
MQVQHDRGIAEIIANGGATCGNRRNDRRIIPGKWAAVSAASQVFENFWLRERTPPKF